MSDVLADLEALLREMPAEAKAALDREIAAELAAAWLPNPGPQTQALESKADILLYGGAAGGGKTDLLLGAALTRHERTVIFRRAYVDLKGIEQRLFEIAGRDGWNGQDHAMTRSGLLIEMGSLEKPDAEKSWQGRPHDLIGFDEGAQLVEAKVRFVMGWLRSASGRRCRVIIASNPPVGSDGEWLVVWFAPWLDALYPNPAKAGELRWAVIAPDANGTTVWVDGPGWYVVDPETTVSRPATEAETAAAQRGDPDAVAISAMSRTFVPAFLNDNPYLRSTNYRASLMAMPEPLRSKLLKGDFLAGKEDHPWQVIPSAWVEAAQERWKRREKPAGVPMTTLGVDVAQGGADETVLAPLYRNWFAELTKRKGVDTKNGPDVAALVITTMRDRCLIAVDLTGGWGGSARDHLEAQGIEAVGIVFSAGTEATTKDGKFKFANLRAQMFWQFREALDPESGQDIALPPDRRLAAQLCAPQWKLRGEAILIESKEDIRARLGSSTDDADAIVIAWHSRDEAMSRSTEVDDRPVIDGGWMG